MQFPSIRQLINLLPIMVLVLAAITTMTGLLIPLYSDEIAVQMLRSRFFLEGRQLLNLLPQCHSLVAPAPITWYAGAILNAIFYSGASEIGLRIRGIALCLTWLSLLWIWAGRHPQTLQSKHRFQTLIISFNLLGILPFVLFLARSEQLLVIALVLYMMLPLFWRLSADDRAFTKFLKIVLFLLITSVFFMAHPKALFFAPVVLVSAWLTFQERNIFWKTGIFLIIFFSIFQSVQYAQTLSKCTDAPLMAQSLAQHTLNFKLFFTDTLSFFKAALQNLFSSLSLLLDRMPATPVYQSNWLPSTENKSLNHFLNEFGNLLKISLLLSILLLIASFIYRLTTQILHKRFRPETLLGLAVVTGLIVHAAVYNINSWHFYTPGLVIPSLVILLLLTLHEPAVMAGWMTRAANIVASYYFLLAFASLVILLFIVTPQLIKIAKMDEHVIPNQPLSTPVFLSNQRKAEIPALAAQCGIKESDKRLVLDGEAYFHFQAGVQPINVLYISDYAFGMDIASKIPEFLRHMDSGGVISRCEYLPRILREKAITSGILCCVPKTAW